MKVFLTGATGAIGRPAVPLLVAAGHEVTAVARGPAKAAQVAAAGATAASVDLFDAEAVHEAVAGHEAVVHLATNIPPMGKAARRSAWATNDRLRAEASAHLVEAALATGARRYVQESVGFLYPDGGDQWMDAETTSPQPYPALASALVAESHARRFTDRGGTGVVLRFGMFYGPGLAHTDALLRMARWGLAFSAGGRGRFLSSVHVDDAAAAVVAALTVPPGVYDVVDDEPLTSARYAAALAAAAGRRRYLRVPGRLIRLGGPQVEAFRRSQRISNRRFRDATGWTPRWPDAAQGLAHLDDGSGR